MGESAKGGISTSPTFSNAATRRISILIALRGTDLTLEAPDGQAFVTVGVEATGGKTADAAALQGEADRVITSMGLFVSGVISHRSGTAQKALYVVAGARITTAADLSVDVIVLVTVRGGRVYLLIGAVTYMHNTATYNPAHDQELQDLTRIFARSSVS